MQLPSSQPTGPVDLDALNEYLNSDRAPPDSMDVSQLDGFLAGVIVGPDMVPPSEFLSVVWGGDEPEFEDLAEAETVVGSILGRYNEIADGLAGMPPSYAPVFWLDSLGNTIAEDWAVGFMQAVALRPESWEAALLDEDTAIMLIPIGIIAGAAHPELALHDSPMPEGFVDELTERAGELLPECVVGLRQFWVQRATDDPEPPPAPKYRH
jgi:uncharacterized protein